MVHNALILSITMAASTLLSLLTAVQARDHIHVVLGTNSLAATRCAQSLAVGARPIVIAAETNEGPHYTLQSHIDSGEVKWLRREFAGQDLFELGREETGRVVDAVFVTTGQKTAESEVFLTSLLGKEKHRKKKKKKRARAGEQSLFDREIC